MNDLILIENTIPLTTSYKVAEELDIKHRSLMQLIKDHKSIIEKHFGHMRFENAVGYRPQGGGRSEHYAILTENQANYVLMLSGNTEKSMEVKALFVKAFAEAKEELASRKQKQSQQEQMFTKDVQRRCMLNEKLLKPGYWCVVTEMWREAWTLETFQKELKPSSLPDGSCGTKWRNHLKDSKHWQLSKSYQEYLHVPNLHHLVKVWVYPDALLFEFRRWLRVEYAEYYDTQYSPSRVKGKDDRWIEEGRA